MIPIHVAMLPVFAEQADLSGQAAVMIDVLRASTTIVHALSSDAAAVVPCSTVEQTREIAATIPAENRLLGGERNCQRIEGFDLDNSPLKYRPEVVAGKQIIFTSTNGTYTLERCRAASRIFTGAFVNFSAIAQTLIELKFPVHLVCAGTNRQLTAEDILFAGAVVDRLLTSHEFEVADVQAQMAVDFYRSRPVTSREFRQAIFGSLGAENLVKLQMHADIERAMQVDLFDIVPEWDADENLITQMKR
jgi:2-phosphosulfolactate phosphatase